MYVNCYTDSVRWTFGGAEVQNAGNCSSLLAMFHHHFHSELIELLKVVWTFFQKNCLKKTKAKARDCNWHSKKYIVTGVSTFSVVYRGTLINYSGLYTVFTVGVWKQSASKFLVYEGFKVLELEKIKQPTTEQHDCCYTWLYIVATSKWTWDKIDTVNEYSFSHVRLFRCFKFSRLTWCI